MAAAIRAGERLVEATIVDLSASGALLECERIGIAPGASVSLEITCFGSEQPIGMLAMHVRDTPSGCALRFTDPDPFLRVFVKLVRAFQDGAIDPLEKLLSES